MVVVGELQLVAEPFCSSSTVSAGKFIIMCCWLAVALDDSRRTRSNPFTFQIIVVQSLVLLLLLHLSPHLCHPVSIRRLPGEFFLCPASVSKFRAVWLMANDDFYIELDFRSLRRTRRSVAFT